jgi:predicted DNA-binding transcriptional regulator YafY
LVDNFGQNSEFIKGETINTQNSNINLPFPKDKGYTIRIRDVDYNSIKRLCLNMQDDMYVLAPESLRNEIISELERKLTIYKQL